eukprot:scaffold91817_cov75-Phaeocystis_antarctica.AAC.8
MSHLGAYMSHQEILWNQTAAYRCGLSLPRHEAQGRGTRLSLKHEKRHKDTSGPPRPGPRHAHACRLQGSSRAPCHLKERLFTCHCWATVPDRCWAAIEPDRGRASMSTDQASLIRQVADGL